MCCIQCLCWFGLCTVLDFFICQAQALGILVKKDEDSLQLGECGGRYNVVKYTDKLGVA